MIVSVRPCSISSPVLLRFYPLDKCRLILAVISCTFVKIQCFLIFRSCKEHHFITVVLFRNISRVIKTLRSISPASEPWQSHNIFNKRIRPDIPGKIRNDHTDTGRYNSNISFKSSYTASRTISTLPLIFPFPDSKYFPTYTHTENFSWKYGAQM